MGITFSGVIIGSSLRNMDNSKNRIIAVNVAREGIEAVRNIRDTNWLKFNSKRRQCWNHVPPVKPEDGCSTPTAIPSGDYIIYKQGISTGSTNSTDPTQRWRLQKMTDGGVTITELPTASMPCDATNDRKYYHNTTNGFTYRCNRNTGWENIAQLYLVDIDPNVNTDGDTASDRYDNDQDIYNHIYTQDKDAGDEETFGNIVKRSLLSRVITIQYLDNSGAIASPTANVNRMRVTSTVYWQKGAKRFKVELITHLTDYLGREQLSG